LIESQAGHDQIEFDVSLGAASQSTHQSDKYAGEQTMIAIALATEQERHSFSFAISLSVPADPVERFTTKGDDTQSLARLHDWEIRKSEIERWAAEPGVSGNGCETALPADLHRVLAASEGKF